MNAKSILRAMRLISGSALMGTVVAGAFFSWVSIPALIGFSLTVHEIGAGIGVMVGLGAATVKTLT